MGKTVSQLKEEREESNHVTSLYWISMKMLFATKLDHIDAKIAVKMGEVPLNHLLGLELGSAGEGEPQTAPLRSYELLWRKLHQKYPQDCGGIIRAHRAAQNFHH